MEENVRNFLVLQCFGELTTENWALNNGNQPLTPAATIVERFFFINFRENINFGSFPLAVVPLYDTSSDNSVFAGTSKKPNIEEVFRF